MATMNSGLGGATGYGTNSFLGTSKVAGGNDDGSVLVDVSSVFGGGGLNIGGTSYSDIYINSNGTITFDSAETSPSPTDISTYPSPIIAPFWTDINLNSGGDILWDVDPASGKVTITWHDVAPYSGSGTNSFQVVLTNTGSGDFDVDFIYEDIQFSNGGSGVAEGGISDGGANDLVLDGSGNSADVLGWESNQFADDDANGTYSLNVSGGVPGNMDGVVDGSGGDDTLTLGDTDGDGDAITTGDDSILGGGGDDSIDASGGEDTVHGGGGSDTISGGSGADLIYGDGEDGETPTATTSINITNYTDTTSGFKVSARNVESGSLTSADTGNVSTAMGGIGAGGAISDSDSSVAQQTGFDKASGISEELIVDFDDDIDSLSFSFSKLFTNSYGEQAQWSIYENGTLIAQSTFTEIGSGSGSGTIDVSGFGSFDSIVFRGLLQTDGTDGSDFFITDVTFDASASSSDTGDKLSGGTGNDTIYGETGSDTIYGHDGDDDIYGGTGNDAMSGGADADTFFIEDDFGNDKIKGGEAGNDDDTIDLTALSGAVTVKYTDNEQGTITDGSDTINFLQIENMVLADGNDVLDASADSAGVTIDAGAGRDTITGGSGADSIDAGDGHDRIFVSDGFGADTISGGSASDTGSDDLVFSNLSQGVTVTFSGAETGSATDGADTLGFDEIEGIIGSDHDDLIDATAVSGDGPYVVAGDGNDTILGGTGYDDLRGGEGNDSILGGEGGNNLEGGGGDDTVIGGSGSDGIYGNTGDDSLSGAGGDDWFSAGSGADTIEGGTGDDYIEVQNDSDEDVIVLADGSGADTVYGFDGPVDIGGGVYESEDRLDVSGLHDGNGALVNTNDVVVTDTNGDGTGHAILTFPNGESITLQNVGVSAVSTPEQLHAIGIPLPNYIVEGTAGADVIDASYVGDPEGDMVDALDNVPGNNDDDIEAGAGDDTITGGAGSDRIKGGDDQDTFIATDGFGNDTVFGGEGGTDSDTLHLSGLSGSVTVSYTGDEAGTVTDGTDTITFSEIERLSLPDGDNLVDGSADGAGLHVWSGSGDDTIIGGTGKDTVFGFAGDDSISGGSGSDSLDGDDGDDTIEGGSGSDTLIGDGGADSLTGGAENDQIYAGADDDTLSGGTGDDALYGQGGADTFVIEDDFGADTIYGGSDNDTMDASAMSGPVTVDYSGNDAGTATDGTDTLSFAEIESLKLTDSNDSVDGAATTSGITVEAMLGDDTVTGGSGGDRIDGGGGHDEIHGGGGSDTLEGGTGHDTLIGGTGDDVMTGGLGHEKFVYTAGDGDDTISDFNTGNTGGLLDGDSGNNDYIDLSSFYDNLSELYADQQDDGVLNQSNTSDTKGRSVNYGDNDAFGSGSLTFTGATADNSSFTGENTNIVCFTSDTAIRTPRGDVLIDDLNVGDLVSTMDNGPQEIRWIGCRSVAARGKLAPIRIAAGALGAGLPRRDLLVSPQHRMWISSRIAARVCNTAEVLVAASKLTSLPGVSVEPGGMVTYIHLLCDRHEILFAEDAPSESLFTGPEALRALGAEAREEIMTLFPDIPRLPPQPARAIPAANIQRRIIERHVKNRKPVIAHV